MAPLINFVPSADSPPQAPKHIVAAPTRAKRKAEDQPPLAPRIGRGKTGAPAGSVPLAAAGSSAAANLLRRTQTMDSRSGSEMGGSTRGRRRSSYSMGSSSSTSRTPSPIGSRRGGANEDGSGGSDDDYTGTGDPSLTRDVKPRVRAPPRAPVNGGRRSRPSAAEVEPEMAMPTMPLGQAAPTTDRYARMILDYFVSESSHVPDFLLNPPADFDPNVVIDDDGHTALHWAAAMARIRVVKLLLSAGADLFRANAEGQTALMRSVQFTNSYDLRRFGEMFELLHRSSINIDRRDRTVFHYIVDIALAKGKAHAARYYLTTVLARLGEYPHEVAEILNYQDDEGETALTLAARARSKRLVRMLVEAGASPRIRNNEGKSAEDYIVEDERYRTSSPLVSAATGEALPVAPAALPVKLRKSDTARKLGSVVMPQLAELVDGIAGTYEAEMDAHDRELAHTQAVIAQIEAELREGHQPTGVVAADGLAAMAQRERELETELAVRMGKRFRFGYEKYSKDEHEREMAIRAAGQPLPADLAALYDPPSSPGVETELGRDLDQLRHDRVGLFDELVRRVKTRAPPAHVAAPVRMDRLRRLVSIGCQIPLDTVDATLPALLDAFEPNAQMVS